MKNLALMAGFNTIQWWFVVVASEATDCRPVVTLYVFRKRCNAWQKNIIA